MKSSMKSSKKLALGMTLACTALGTTTAMAATDGEIQTAIDNGLAYLANTQTGGGYWNYGGYEPAATGAAAFAMLSQKSHWGDVNLSNIAKYQADVDKAMTYLLNNATAETVATRNDGVNICPGGGVAQGSSGTLPTTKTVISPA